MRIKIIFVLLIIVCLLLVGRYFLNQHSKSELELFEVWESKCVNYKNGFTNSSKFSEKARYEVQHINRPYFIPQKGIECELVEKLEKSSDKFVLVFIQVEPPIGSKEQKDNYRALGIKFSNYVPLDTWLAVIPADLEYMSDLIKNYNVRWIGEYYAEEKISPYIKNGNIADHTKNFDGTYKLGIKFAENVSQSEAAWVILKHGGIPISWTKSINHYASRVPKYQIDNLAEDYRVIWIDELPGPPVDKIVKRIIGGIFTKSSEHVTSFK